MRVSHPFYTVYIVTNKWRTVLYTGVSNELFQRVTEHYLDQTAKKTFAGKYNTHLLLYFEPYNYINTAIAREKEIKGWSRKKKIELIKTFNPELRFLNKEVFGEWPPTNATHRGEEE